MTADAPQKGIQSQFKMGRQARSTTAVCGQLLGRALLCLLLWPVTNATTQSLPTNIRSGLNGCPPTDIPVTDGNLPFALISEQKYYSDRMFSGSVRFKNFSSKSAIRVTALVAYFGQSNQSEPLSIVYFAVPERKIGLVESDPASENPLGMKAPIPPGGTLLLMSSSSMTTPLCPTFAKLELLDVEYMDNTHAHWEATSWDSMPVLRHAPGSFPVPCGQIKPGFSRYLTLHINSNGTVTDVKSQQVTAASTRECVLKDMRQWLFYPAMHDSHSVPYDLPILLRAGSAHLHPFYPRKSEIPFPLVMIDIYPSQVKPGKWRIWYSGFPLAENNS